MQALTPTPNTGRKPLPGDGGQDPVLLESAASKGDSGHTTQANSSAEGPSCPLTGSAQGPGLRDSGTHTFAEGWPRPLFQGVHTPSCARPAGLPRVLMEQLLRTARGSSLSQEAEHTGGLE